ncbi:phage major capsid protein [Azospirillum canadense]|uniref:phage major capsid protein n=1 Tax=Azospirillum canadense TaxID=403962 RepID=UPI0022277398|nr:phage major capsid protein [Azospirillum canadense]MCW2243585.1 HK97 family phage major capsid protein [Azospirillum canadense]
MPVDIIGLRQERAKAYEGLTAILTATDGRAMTAEEQVQFDTAEAAVKDFDATIKNAERVQALRATTAVPSRTSVADDDRGSKPAATVPATPAAREEPGIDLARYTRAIVAAKGNLDQAATWAAAQFGESHPVVIDIQGAMQTNDMAGGGIFVPERLSNELIALLYPKTVIRRISRVVPLVGGTDTVPTVEKGINAYYIGEGEDITTDEPSFGALSFKEREIASLVPLSNKLLRLSRVGIDQYVRDMMLEGFAQAEDTAFLRGSGTGPSPKGLRYYIPAGQIFDATGGVAPTAAQVDADTRKMILALSTAEIPMVNVRWLMHDRVFLYLADLRDANGNLIYPSLNAPTPTFRGYPVERFHRIPTNLSDGSNADCTELYLGDFSFSMVADSYSVRIDASDTAAYKQGNTMVSAYSKNQTLIRGLAGHDYGVTRPKAFAMLNKVRWGA